MSANLWPLVVAFLAGMAMALQGSLNSALGKVIGLLQATLVVHFSAAIVVVILLLFWGGGFANFSKAVDAPWYYYLGGILGVLITYGVVASIPRVGVALATTAIIVGQVGTAVLVDHLGVFNLEAVPFTWHKALGLAFLAVGARLMLWR